MIAWTVEPRRTAKDDLAQDDYYYEIQLTNKQLVFYFMAGATGLILSFLAGVMVGRGVDQGAGGGAGRAARPGRAHRRRGDAAARRLAAGPDLRAAPRGRAHRGTAGEGEAEPHRDHAPSRRRFAARRRSVRRPEDRGRGHARTAAGSRPPPVRRREAASPCRSARSRIARRRSRSWRASRARVSAPTW